ncbi:cytochrome P450 [Nonomuraea roseoviolacea]|uniref:Cytochrome P450 n=1 Tax=Nonomuraea roseoviolacea subsp. carminata TaxID=160689 RepID=A0ABT1JTW6_9ACTN|nr:cytochrome P450 [Nonomuraea roseoviolacea]MCP2345182.1 cytochrome P450 [Nonomuraea roseoviolacea subsp. carminata]
MVITRHDEARAVLADPRYVPPPVRQDAPPYTLGWLRAQVSRFSSGETHAERRRALDKRLAQLDPAALRRMAREATLERGGDRTGVPTAVLAAALGVAAPVSLVEAAATGYLSGEETPEADAAVAELTALLGDGPPAVTDLTLLLQAHAATEGLIANALTHADRAGVAGSHRDQGGAAAPHGDQGGAAASRGDRAGVEGLLQETLRHDPPLKASRRVERTTGEEVVIDLVAANRDPAVFADPERFDPARGETPHLTFGHGLRPCPASAHALALAAGVLDGLRATADRSAPLPEGDL